MGRLMPGIGHAIDVRLGRVFDNRVLFCAIAIAVTACVILFVLRIMSAISFTEPLQLTTSGSEEESLFGIWKVVHGESLYNDRLKIPYAAIVYNWLFYYSYGAAVGIASSILSLGDEWLPTLARTFTLAGIVALTIGAFLSLRQLLGNFSWLNTVLAAGFAAYIGFGPLIGFWGITARPDVWALTWEVIGTYAFLRLYPKRTAAAVAAVAVAAYCAWAFKQTNVTLLCAAAGVLLFRLNFRALAALVAIMGLAFVATFTIGGAQYTKSILFVGWRPEYHMDHFRAVFENFALKAAPGLVGFAVAAIWIVARGYVKSALRNDAILLGFCGALAAAVLNGPLTSHLGAGENYYFSLNWFLIVVSVSALPSLLSDVTTEARFAVLTLTGGWLALALAAILVLTGFQGTVSLRPLHAYYSKAKLCLDNLPRPLYVNRPYLSLPWITPGSIPFVVSWFYYFDRKNGLPFEEGALKGLIATQRLAAVVITRVNKTELIDGLDGNDLAGYYKTTLPECPEFIAYLRDDTGRGQ